MLCLSLVTDCNVIYTRLTIKDIRLIISIVVLNLILLRKIVIIQTVVIGGYIK